MTPLTKDELQAMKDTLSSRLADYRAGRSYEEYSDADWECIHEDSDRLASALVDIFFRLTHPDAPVIVRTSGHKF